MAEWEGCLVGCVFRGSIQGYVIGSLLLFTWEVDAVLEVKCPFWLPCFSILLKTGVKRVIYFSYMCMLVLKLFFELY
jgi:hypothetical protein